MTLQSFFVNMDKHSGTMTNLQNYTVIHTFNKLYWHNPNQAQQESTDELLPIVDKLHEEHARHKMQVGEDISDCLDFYFSSLSSRPVKQILYCCQHHWTLFHFYTPSLIVTVASGKSRTAAGSHQVFCSQCHAWRYFPLHHTFLFCYARALHYFSFNCCRSHVTKQRGAKAIMGQSTPLAHLGSLGKRRLCAVALNRGPLYSLWNSLW